LGPRGVALDKLVYDCGAREPERIEPSSASCPSFPSPGGAIPHKQQTLPGNPQLVKGTAQFCGSTPGMAWALTQNALYVRKLQKAEGCCEARASLELA